MSSSLRLTWAEEVRAAGSVAAVCDVMVINYHFFCTDARWSCWPDLHRSAFISFLPVRGLQSNSIVTSSRRVRVYREPGSVKKKKHANSERTVSYCRESNRYSRCCEGTALTTQSVALLTVNTQQDGDELRSASLTSDVGALVGTSGLLRRSFQRPFAGVRVFSVHVALLQAVQAGVGVNPVVVHRCPSTTGHHHHLLFFFPTRETILR